MGNNKIVSNIKVVWRRHPNATALFLADIFVGGDYVAQATSAIIKAASQPIQVSADGKDAA